MLKTFHVMRLQVIAVDVQEVAVFSESMGRNPRHANTVVTRKLHVETAVT